MNFVCPHCEQRVISPIAKYRSGYWGSPICPGCGATLCCSPVWLALFWTLYVWCAAWFYGLYHYGSPVTIFLWLPVAWLILDLLNITLLPLVVMKRPATAP